MINVKVLFNRESVFLRDLESCKYYSCISIKSQQKRVFITIPSTANERKMVIWLNSFSENKLGFDYLSTLQEDYCDFKEIKDAELTFYV